MRINVPLFSQIYPWELSVLHIVNPSRLLIQFLNQDEFANAVVASFLDPISSANYIEETEFLTTNGLKHFTEKFQQEEISMEIMGQLTDEMLRELGISTIGARI